MNFLSTLKLSLRNIKSNKTLFLPYILSSTFMLSVMFIMSSLISNEYVRTRHIHLQFIMGFGMLLSFIFVFAFIVYINNFINKKRNKELTLYNILGLEKRHIAKIIFMEQLIIYSLISILSILGGYVFGRVSFLILSRLIQDVEASVTKYSFSKEAAFSVIFIIALLFVINLFISIRRITFLTPTELLASSRKNESGLKNKKFFSIIGIILLLSGYGIAITTKGFLSSLGYFFIAVILVIFGMYLFFVFSTTEVLSLLRNKKKFYYKKKNFFWVSGMITRMKSNGVSLATITILCTCIIVTLSSTSTIDKSMKDRLELIYPKQFQLTYHNQNLDSPDLGQLEKNMNKIIDMSSTDKIRAKERNISVFRVIPSLYKNNKIVYISDINKSLRGRGDSTIFITFETLDTFNQKNNTKVGLKDGEILISQIGDKDMSKVGSIKIYGKNYKIKDYNIPYKSLNLSVFEGVNIVVKSPKELIQIIRDSEGKNNKKDLLIDVSMDWNVDGLRGSEKHYIEEVQSNIKDYKITNGLIFTSKKTAIKEMYSFNGGFVFMGVIVSLVFLMGIVLVTYYKQVFEGYADRENIQIMKKVGLDNGMIRKNSLSQIMWFFFTPLVISLLNTLVASRILYNLLTLFGLNSYFVFLKIILIVFIAVFFVYYILYRMTLKVYYRIVS